VKFLHVGAHAFVFLCSHKFLYDDKLVCIKVKNQRDKTEDFLYEYEVGRFFRKFGVFLNYIIILLAKVILLLIMLINLKRMKFHNS
jgi:hypothetical protein